MSTSNRRRNRSLASCEPCRKSKIRCDHIKPTCTGCRRRGLVSQCFYHPAPLTRSRNAHRQAVLTPPQSNSAEDTASSPIGGNHHETPSSLSARAPRFTWPFMNPKGEPTLLAPIPVAYDKWEYDEHLSTIKKIVSKLRFLTIIEERLKEYFSLSQVALVKPVVLQLLTALRSGLVDAGHINDGISGLLDVKNIDKLSKDILHSSSTAVTIIPTIDLRAFCALFCGPNLRVETLGLLYTMAARSSLYSWNTTEEKDHAFVREMKWYSNICLRLARDLAPQTTDITVWLAYENLQLTSLLDGDASIHAWRRLGDLATDLFALGLNREETYSPEIAPFFLVECRRKTFATVCYLDKSFAIVFNRPPRLSSRHADCRLPLELSDEELCEITWETLPQAKAHLTADGWNTDGKYRPTTWARIRCILSHFREETVEYQIRSEGSADPVKLRRLSARCAEAWNNLPSHLKYREDCWKSTLSPAICIMLGKVYLSYLHINFQIHQLLGEGPNFSPELLEVSSRMLETVVQMLNARLRATISSRDLPEVALSYGLPCTAVLTAALEQTTHNPSLNLPNGIKAPNLIRNLSVLASQLESVSSARDTNHVFCLRASKTLSCKLDAILDPGPTRVLSASRNPETLTTTGPDPDMSIMNLFDDFDLTSWAIDFDLGEVNREWDIV